MRDDDVLEPQQQLGDRARGRRPLRARCRGLAGCGRSGCRRPCRRRPCGCSSISRSLPMSCRIAPATTRPLFKPRPHVGIVVVVLVGQIDRRARDAQHVLQPAADEGMMIVRGRRQRQQRLAMRRRADRRPGRAAAAIVDPLVGRSPSSSSNIAWRSNRDCGRHMAGEKPSAVVGRADLANLAHLELRAVVRVAIDGPQLVERAGCQASRQSAPQGESSQMGNLTSRAWSRKPTLKYGLPSRVVSSSLPVISTNRSASWPCVISDSATIDMSCSPAWGRRLARGARGGQRRLLLRSGGPRSASS